LERAGSRRKPPPEGKGKEMSSKKIELTEAQILALIHAIEITEGSFSGYELEAEDKRELAVLERVLTKLENA
jgi:hypothetical protein